MMYAYVGPQGSGKTREALKRARAYELWAERTAARLLKGGPFALSCLIAFNDTPVKALLVDDVETPQQYADLARWFNNPTVEVERKGWDATVIPTPDVIVTSTLPVPVELAHRYVEIRL